MKVALPALLHTNNATLPNNPSLYSQGLGGDGTANNVALQANRHPGMEQVYRTYFKKLEEGLNMSLVMHYTSVAAFTDRMFWGVMEWQDASE